MCAGAFIDLEQLGRKRRPARDWNAPADIAVDDENGGSLGKAGATRLNADGPVGNMICKPVGFLKKLHDAVGMTIREADSVVL